MDNKLISIVVPVYNVEDLLDKSVESLKNQSYKNIEILLVDDGSTDNSGNKCDEFKKTDDRIKVFHKKNGGLSDARNYGIKKAKGEYITFIDSDDYVENDYVEYLYSLIKKYDCTISCCTHTVRYDNGKSHGLNIDKDEKISKIDFFKKMLYSKDIEVSAWAKMYKTSYFDDVKYPIGKLFEDVDTTYKLVDKTDFIACGYSSKYNYMIRNNSITTGKFSDKHFYMVEATENMCNYLNKYPELKKACNRRMCYSYISTLNRMIKFNYKEKDIIKKYRRTILKYFSIVFDKNSSFRDKIAIITIMPGVKVYKMFWHIYSKLTGRR